MIEKYLGGINTSPSDENYINRHEEYAKGKIYREIAAGKAKTATTITLYTGNFDYTTKNKIALNLLSKYFTNKLLEQIREKDGDTYSIGAYPSSTKIPESKYTITIYYTTSPERVRTVYDNVQKVAAKIIEDGISKKELDKEKEKYMLDRQKGLKQNGYWIGYLVQNEMVHPGKFLTEKKFDKTFNDISVHDINRVAKKWFTTDNVISISQVPEK